MKHPILAALFVLTMSLAQSPAFAAKQPLIPADAALLTQLSQSDSSTTNIKGNILALQPQVATYIRQNNLELRCESVYTTWSNQKDSSTDVGAKLWNGGGHLLCDVITLGMCIMADDASDGSHANNTVYANIYCKERSFAEKMMISAEQSCEKEPKAECMSPAYIEQFQKIKQTVFKDIGLPSDLNPQGSQDNQDDN